MGPINFTASYHTFQQISFIFSSIQIFCSVNWLEIKCSDKFFVSIFFFVVGRIPRHFCLIILNKRPFEILNLIK